MDKISPSQLSNYMDCPQEWDFAYRVKIKRKGSRRAFDIGNYFHELMHVYYQLIAQGVKPGSDYAMDYIMSRVRRDIETGLTLDNVEIVNVVSKMVSRFISQQSPKIDSGIKVLYVEKYMEVPIVTNAGREVVLHGVIDLLYEDRSGRIHLRDHKTGAKMGSWNQKKLELNHQLLMYAIMLHLSKENDWPLVLDTEISFINSYPYKTAQTNEKLFDFFRYQHNETAINNFISYIKNLIDHMYSTPVIPRYSTDCSSCSYFDICTLQLRGHDTAGVINTYYEKRDRAYGDTSNTFDINAQGAPENTEGNEAS